MNHIRHAHEWLIPVCHQQGDIYVPLETQAMDTTPSKQGGCGYPLASVDDGVQAATDAHELVSSLRSEVSALERHRTALQADLERLEDATAATIDQTAATAAWAAGATPKRGQGSSSSALDIRKLTSDRDEDENLTNRADETNVEQQMPSAKKVAAPRGEARKRARVERKARAAEILRQALGSHGGEANIERTVVGAPVESQEARAVEFAREARQMAQENFAPRSVAEM